MHYSQNFLKSPRLVGELLDRSNILNSYKIPVIEVGVGEGIITDQVLRRVADDIMVTGIEIDESFVKYSEQRFKNNLNLSLIHADFIDYPLPDNDLIIISNLPFAHTSKLMRKILDPRNKVQAALLIIQKEAADMFMGIPRCSVKSLSVYPFYDFEVIHQIDREDFKPQPSIGAVTLMITRKKEPLFDVGMYGQYMKLVRKLSNDRVGEGIWKELLPKNKRNLLVKKFGLVKSIGISKQKPEAIVSCIKYLLIHEALR